MSRSKTSKKLLTSRERPSVLLALGWYSAAMHRGIARYAGQAGWSLDINMVRSGHAPASWNGSGIICVLQMDAALDRLAENAKVPVVHIGNKDHPRIPRVVSDNAAVGRMAAEYFLQKGFKNFSFYLRTGSLGEKLRFEFYQQRINAAGYRVQRIDWVSHAKSLSPLEREVARASWLGRQIARLARPTAIFAEYDDLAVEVLNACREANIPVPEQAAVLGVDNDPLRCEFATVPLSSIDDDQELIGYEAAAMLDRLMQGKEPEHNPRLIPPRGVTTRLSTDILAVEHPLVAAALRKIWDHYTEPIGAKQIAAEIPMSYRRLHDAFIQHVGHSIAGEIARKRIEHARRLLEETDKKMIEVAWLSGFTDHDRMGKVFRRILGVTPAAYRRRFKK